MGQNQPAPIDTLFQSYDRNLYKIQSDALEDSILDSLNSNPQQNNSTSVNIDPSDIGSGVMTGTMQTATGSQQQGKKLFTDTTEGYILGVDPSDGLAKFAIGNDVSFFQWDGTNIETTGTINATGFTLVDGSGNMVVSGNTSGASTTFALVVTPTSAVPSGIYVNNSQANGYGILLNQSAALSTFSPLQISNAGKGSNLFINSNSLAGPTLALQNNTPGTGVLSLAQFGVTSSHFSAIILLASTGNTIWLSDGTTPNGNLAGTRGDFCFNGAGGHAFWCSTTGTAWTQI